jgi:hypothetical protein
MGSFSLWHWLFVLVPVVIIIWAVAGTRRSSASHEGRLVGISGWLGLLAVMQVIQVPGMIAAGVVDLLMSIGFARLPDSAIVGYFMMTMTVAKFLLSLATTYALFAERRFFARLFLYQWLAQPLALILTAITLSIAQSMTSAAAVMTLFLDPSTLVSSILGFFIGGLWVWYTRVSVRVKNTMIR